MPTFAAQMSAQFRSQCVGASDFMNQYKALSDEDKHWYWEQLNKCGFPCLAPGKSAQ